MEYGTTIGDDLSLLDGDTTAFSFAEVALGRKDLPVDSVDPEEVRAQFDGAGLDPLVHLPFAPPLATGVPEIDDGMSAYLTRAMDVAASFGARKGVVHASALEPDDAAQIDSVREQVAALTDAGRNRDLEVVVENIGQIRRGLPLAQIGEIVADVGGSLCFDVGHAFLEDGQQGLESFLGSYGDLVSHVHLHDVRMRGDEHIPVGSGEIDFGRVADRLAGRDVTLAAEIFTHGSLRFQRAGIREMKDLLVQAE